LLQTAILRVTTFLENPEYLEISGNFAVVKEMSEKNLVRENCYNVCMVWVADTVTWLMPRHGIIMVISP